MEGGEVVRNFVWSTDSGEWLVAGPALSRSHHSIHRDDTDQIKSMPIIVPDDCLSTQVSLALL